MKEVCSSLGLYIGIWLYPEYVSMKLSSSCPVVASTSWFICGWGKLSFGYALFKFVKSMHVLYFPLDFRTNTGLANQLG